MVFCSNCGQEVDETDTFCKSCGKSLVDDDNEKNENKITNSNSIGNSVENIDNEKLFLIPIILGIIGILVGIIEGLSCPILFGWDFILIEMAISIIGGCGGLFLYYYKKEYLLSGIQFIITGIIMILCIGNMAMIGCTIFIIAGVSAIFIGKDFTVKDKTNIIIPILTLIIPILLFVIFGGANGLIQGDLANHVSIDNVQNSIVYSYGYYDGSLDGDIHVDTNFDYLELDIEYYDSEGKVLYSGLAWNQLDAEAGKTYHFSSSYIDEKQPVSAQITLKDDSLDEEPFYVQNVTLV